MDLDKLNKWLVLLANFGVMVGVIFLAVEVRQNQIMLEEVNIINRFEARMAPVDTFNEWIGIRVQDEELTRIYMDGRAGKELTEIDEERFNTLCSREFWIHLKIHEGSIATGDTATTARHLDLIGGGLAQSAGYRKCWNLVKNQLRMYGANTFVDGIESRQ